MTKQYVKEFNSEQEFMEIINKLRNGTFLSSNEQNEYERKLNPAQNFSEYTTYHLKQLKLQYFKKYKIKLTERLLQGEGFDYIEINKILGRTDLKKIDTEEEDDELVFG